MSGGQGGALLRRRVHDDASVGWHETDDAYPLRTFRWEADAPRGSILFLGGRGDFFEKYLEAFGHWRARGWNVDAFDWRGHGGSPRLTADPLIGHSGSFARLVADLADLATAWRDRTAGPHVVMGHSMGGHLLLRALVERRIVPDAAVLLSPMIRIRTPLGVRLSEVIASWQVRRGNGARGPWKESASAANQIDSMSMMTGDLERYLDEQFWLDENPAFRLGPPSWSWLAEAFSSSRELRANPEVGSLHIPLLLMVADRDRLTHSGAALRLIGQLPHVTVHRFGKGVAHELLREREPVRSAAMAAIDDFLAAIAAPGGQF